MLLEMELRNHPVRAGVTRGLIVVFSVIVLAPLSAERLIVTVSLPEEPQSVNRGIFSVVNLQRSFAERSPASWERIRDLNLAGTHVRTETMIDLLEPVNDNDDPERFDWDHLRTDQMFRFLPGMTEPYSQAVDELQGVPVILLTYNVPWLATHGRANDPPWSNDEWAEFAAAVVDDLIARHRAGTGPFPRYVEVWNEPGPGGPYWTGTVDEYIALFRTVAARIHRDYPGVLVGGPSFLADQGVHLMRFLEAAGDVADFITIHVYNDDAVLMRRRLERWIDYIREVTGREIPLMVTEADNWQLTGAEKFAHLMVRQFELLAAPSTLVGVHQFSLPYYPESRDRVFGLVRPDGRVVAHNYWPYWFFAPFAGDRLPVTVERELSTGEPGPIADDRGLRDPARLYAVASRQVSTAEEHCRTTVLLYARHEPAVVEVALPAQVVGAEHELTVTAVTVEGPTVVCRTAGPTDANGLRVRLAIEPATGYQIQLSSTQ